MAVGLGEKMSGCQRCQQIEDEESKTKEGNEVLKKLYGNHVQDVTCKFDQFYRGFTLDRVSWGKEHDILQGKIAL